MLFFPTLRHSKRAARRATSQASKLLKGVWKAPRPSSPLGTPSVKRSRPEPAPKAPGRFLEIGFLRVHYIARGKGRPVVLLHGNGTMAEDFLVCGLIQRLADRYRVIAIDRPGFGYTNRPRARIWTAMEQADLIHKVLALLKVDRPLVVGHSWGTLVALALASGAWRELRGLVLLSGYYYPGRRADVTLSKLLAVPGFGDAARAMTRPAMNRLLAAQSFRHVFRPQRVPPRFEAEFPVEIAMGRTQLRASAEDASTMNAAAARLQDSYPHLRLPVAILTGDADVVVDVDEQARRLHGDITGSSLKILPGQGHMIQYSGRRSIELAIDRLMQPSRKQ